MQSMVAVPGAEGTSLSLTIGEESVTLRGETPTPGRGCQAPRTIQINLA